MILLRTAISHSSCSWDVSTYVRASSTRHIIAFSPLSISLVYLWKCSRAEVIPKWKWLKQNLQKGVINDVRIADSLANWTCQKPELEGDYVPYKQFHSVLSSPHKSNLPVGFWIKHHTSTQLCRFLDFHKSSIHSFGSSGSAIILGVVRVNDCSSLLGLMVHR